MFAMIDSSVPRVLQTGLMGTSAAPLTGPRSSGQRPSDQTKAAGVTDRALSVAPGRSADEPAPLECLDGSRRSPMFFADAGDKLEGRPQFVGERR